MAATRPVATVALTCHAGVVPHANARTQIRTLLNALARPADFSDQNRGSIDKQIDTVWQRRQVRQRLGDRGAGTTVRTTRTNDSRRHRVRPVALGRCRTPARTSDSWTSTSACQFSISGRCTNLSARRVAAAPPKLAKPTATSHHRLTAFCTRGWPVTA